MRQRHTNVCSHCTIPKMLRRHEKIYSSALNREMDVLAFGHFGAPVIAFPSGGGKYFDFEGNGMIRVLAPLIENGIIKLYCPPSIDKESWLDKNASIEWRGHVYNLYQHFFVNDLVPTIRHDCNSPDMRIALVGCSLGAYHAANFALKYPHIFHYALCMSGRYDLPGLIGFESDSLDVYFNNPLAYAANLEGGALHHVRNNTHLALVVGLGPWEGVCITETNALADICSSKGISHERDIWGYDSEHDWPWWRKQVVYHLGKTFT